MGRHNLGAASLISFVPSLVAKVTSINTFLSLETTTEMNPPANNMSQIYSSSKVTEAALRLRLIGPFPPRKHTTVTVTALTGTVVFTP
jgi:hypothetical protein